MVPLSIDSRQFWKIEEEYFKSWGSRHILNGPPEMGGLCINVLALRQAQFDSRYLSERSISPKFEVVEDRFHV